MTAFACGGDDSSSTTGKDDGDSTGTNTGGSGSNVGGGANVGGSGNTGNQGVGGTGGGTGGTGGTGGGTGGAGPCLTSEECDDSNSCTENLCTNGVCENPAVNVDDANECTVDACDPATGPSHTPVDPDDGNACTTDVCDPMNGVSNTPIDPNDNNLCTTDTCDPMTGPVNTPIDRNDMNACTLDSCDPAVGPVNQNEIVIFTEDFSDNTAGWTLGTEWQIGPAVASAGATLGGNDPAQDHTQAGDNGVAGVVIGGLASTALHGFYYLESPIIDTSTAPPGSSVELRLWRWLNADYAPFMHSVIEVYNGSAWVTVWNTNDQPSPVPTIDADVPGYGNGWFPMSLDVTAQSNAGFRVRVGFDVTSNGAYSIGQWTVDDVSVVSVPYATDADQCTVVGCDPGTGATFTPLAIQDDGIACTTETCSTNSGVAHVPDGAACNDGNLCTQDLCDVSQGCVNPPIAGIDDGNACTTDACDPATGNVTHTPVNVNDNNACTTDACNPQTGQITHNPITCNDASACTTDSCNPASGCVYTPIVCNDNNNCTSNSCNAASGCVYTQLSQPHSKCVTGVALYGGPNGQCTSNPNNNVIEAVCNADPFCCNNSWDSICVGEVYSVGNSKVCAQSNGNCSHTVCVSGSTLVSGCDSAYGNCVTLICNADPYCCQTAWDSICVGEVASVCGKNCN